MQMFEIKYSYLYANICCVLRFDSAVKYQLIFFVKTSNFVQYIHYA